MTALSKYSISRENNFLLIRLGAAAGVFISHCFPLAGFGASGKPALLGFISLNVFFIISGFLVTKSYMDKDENWSFIKSRILRIYPALIFAVLITTYVIGAWFTNLSAMEFYTNSQVHTYAIKNILLFLPEIPNQLPGVFLDSKYRPIVNAPLWSLPYEVWCYSVLFVFAWVLKARENPKVFLISTTIAFLICYTVFALNYAFGTSDYAFVFGKEAFRLSSMFMLGVLLFCFRSYINISHLTMFLIIVLVCISGLTNRLLLTAISYVGLGYFVLYLAYSIKLPFLNLNKIGDYSYGVYIFGYPIQQAVEQVAPDLSLPIFFLVSFSITLLLAAISWHLIEKRALTLK